MTLSPLFFRRGGFLFPEKKAFTVVKYREELKLYPTPRRKDHGEKGHPAPGA